MSSVVDSETGLKVETWGRLPDGEPLWRASYPSSSADKRGRVYFTASRDTEVARLFIIARVLLGDPLDDNELFLLESGETSAPPARLHSPAWHSAPMFWMIVPAERA